MTFETFYQSDERTWPNQQKDNDKDIYTDKDDDNGKYIKRTPSQSDIRNLWPLRHLIRMIKWTDKKKDNDKDKYTDKDNDNDK